MILPDVAKLGSPEDEIEAVHRKPRGVYVDVCWRAMPGESGGHDELVAAVGEGGRRYRRRFLRVVVLILAWAGLTGLLIAVGLGVVHSSSVNAIRPPRDLRCCRSPEPGAQ